VPQPLASGRERGEAALTLPDVWTNADVVGECAAGELAGAARELSHVQDMDWLALSPGGISGGDIVGDHRITIHRPVSGCDHAGLSISYSPHFHLQTAAAVAEMMLLTWMLVGLAALDAEHLWLPDIVTLPGILLGIVVSLLRGGPLIETSRPSPSVLNQLLRLAFSILIAAALILLIRWIYWLVRRREGIGLGDAKLMAMLAAWLGLPGALLAFCDRSCTLARLPHSFCLPFPPPGRESQTWAVTKLPLGTFLCIGGIVSALWGQPILAAYLRWSGLS
jgi:prepilin signal peptidase PulO-like enzyme (type II secretory pathway)